MVYPCDETSPSGVAEPAEVGIIILILFGPKARIAALVRQHRTDISRFELIDAVHVWRLARRALHRTRFRKWILDHA